MTTQTKPVPSGPMATQPVITITTITTLVSAVFAGIVLAAPQIDPQWEKIVISVITAAYPIVTAAWTWRKVYAPASVQKEVNKAAVTGVASDVAPLPPTEGVNWQDPETWPKTPIGASTTKRG